MKGKLNTVFIISLMVIIFLLSACSLRSFFTNESGNQEDQSSTKSGKTELVISTIPAAAIRLHSDADAFMKRNPNVKIKIDEYEETVYKNQAPELFTSTEKPDVAWYWAERWYHQIVDSGALVPLDDLYKSQGWNHVLPATTLKRYTSPDGHKYSVNIDINWTPVMFYNKAAFLKAGVSEPKTFDDLLMIGPKLKAAGYIPLVSGVGDGFIAGHVFDAVLQRSVPEDQYKELLDRGKKYNKINYTSNSVLDAWKMMSKMSSELMPKGATDMKEDEARALFQEGKAAIYSGMSSEAGILQEQLPQNFDLGFFYYPQLKKDINPKVQIYSGDALMALKGTGKERLAKKFIAFVMSYDRQKALTEQKMFFPSRTDLSIKDLKEYGPLFTSMYQKMQELGTTPLWDDDIPGKMANLSFKLHQSVMAGDKTPQQAGKELQELFDTIVTGKS